MKAIVQVRYGSPDGLELREIDEPVAGDDRVLVRVRAASVNAADWHLMGRLPQVIGRLLGVPRSDVCGRDVAGIVEAVGKEVTRSRLLKAQMRSGGKRQGPFLARVKNGDLLVLKELAEAGKLCPVIDRHCALGDVPDAIRYLGTKHARGKVVVRVGRAASGGIHGSTAG